PSNAIGAEGEAVRTFHYRSRSFPRQDRPKALRTRPSGERTPPRSTVIARVADAHGQGETSSFRRPRRNGSYEACQPAEQLRCAGGDIGSGSPARAPRPRAPRG